MYAIFSETIHSYYLI